MTRAAAGVGDHRFTERMRVPGFHRRSLVRLVAVCPITGQPDLYVASIEYSPTDRCLESKSLKLYLNGFRDQGHFCEALAVKIRDDVAGALGLAANEVTVTLEQKARGGITIT